MPTAPKRFYTARLRAERVDRRHLDWFHDLRLDERVSEWLGGTITRAQSEASLKLELEHWRREGFGFWAFFDRRTGQFVGRGGLRRCKVGGREEVEIAYALVAERWGEGLATEMGEAFVRIGFETVGLAELIAFTLPHNDASRRVMEKLGLVFERDVVHAGQPHVLYRIRSGSSSDG